MADLNRALTAAIANLILVNDEPAEPLSVFAREIGKHPSSLSRWAGKGVALPDGTRVKLEVVRIGRELRTSRQAWRRFLSATSAPMNGTATTPDTSPQDRRRAAESAMRELERLGC